jgi:FkbM family methyltransferase
MNIFYGVEGNYINVTYICLKQLCSNGIIIIPCGDGNRARFFSDPIVNVHKHMLIQIANTNRVYHEHCTIYIYLDTMTIEIKDEAEIENTLISIHSNLVFKHGSLNEEIPEQKMVVRYLTGNEKVLEIGSNVGRNTLVIASVLSSKNTDTPNFVTVECDKYTAECLRENRDLNHFSFHIETAALSKRKLMQKGWDTVTGDDLIDGFNWVDTISLEELYNKYNIQFDTLVLDCEGAFYYILMDMPEILDNINLIIMENDYRELDKKEYVNEVLRKNNFEVEYSESGGWGPCCDFFFEVWKKCA